MGNYDDIINLPRHESKHRAKMPVENRAAQFAPFAALTGHDDAIAETARLTFEKINLINTEKQKIGESLSLSFEKGIPLSIIHFIPDKSKSGGKYQTIKGTVIKIEQFDRIITLDSGVKLQLENIVEAVLNDISELEEI